MDQHPIPQNVTGFQFKLIGTMTVKQFGYVATGVIFAVILYYYPLNTPLAIFIKVLLIPLLGSSGVVVAFVPIDGRPIDVMTANFAKALFSPNQYIFKSQGRKMSFSMVSSVKQQSQQQEKKTAETKPTSMRHVSEKELQLRALLSTTHEESANELDKKENAFLKALEPVPPATVPAVTPTPSPIQKLPTPIIAQPQGSSSLPSKTPPKETPETKDTLTKKEDMLEQALTVAKQEEAKTVSPSAQAVAHKKVELLEKQIEDTHKQQKQLEQELARLKNQLVLEKKPTAVQIKQPPTPPSQDPQHVRAIPQGITKKVGLPHVSDTPNVVVGIVKDPRGNVLSNILVEVKDKEGNPVRAFKTNALGQFASATPLAPGTYTIELEDPKKQQRFDIIQIIANNQIMPPIEVISHDAREELRKQLFTN